MSDESLIMRNAGMHRRRNQRLSDEQLLAKAEQYQRDLVNQALIQLVADECRKRGLCWLICSLTGAFLICVLYTIAMTNVQIRAAHRIGAALLKQSREKMQDKQQHCANREDWCVT